MLSYICPGGKLHPLRSPAHHPRRRGPPLHLATPRSVSSSPRLRMDNDDCHVTVTCSTRRSIFHCTFLCIGRGIGILFLDSSSIELPPALLFATMHFLYLCLPAQSDGSVVFKSYDKSSGVSLRSSKVSGTPSTMFP